MSSHSRPVHDSHQSASQGAPRKVSRRSIGYILAGLLMGMLFVLAAEGHARQIEYLSAVAVPADGAITGMDVTQSGGRQPEYWIAGTYQAVSPAGREVSLPFRFNVTKDEYSAYAVGDTFALIYDPDNHSVPLRATNIEQTDSGRVRALAVLAAVTYALIGGVLSVVDWRRRQRIAHQAARLRSAFGIR